MHRNRQNLHEKACRGDRDKGADVARVARLGDLDDCRVPDDELDPRGWHVLTRESARPGEVADLIVDLDAMTVCYLEVELDADALRLRGARRVLVPADAVWLNEDEEIVRLDVTAADLTAGSTYDPESLSRAARKANPGIDTVVRTHSDAERAYLERLGVGRVVMGERELAFGIAHYALLRFGRSDDEADATIDAIRDGMRAPGAATLPPRRVTTQTRV